VIPNVDVTGYRDIAYYAILIAAALLGIIGILLGLVLRSQLHTKRDSAASLDQLQNSHTSNLRVDLDEKQDETREMLTELGRSVTSIKSDVGGLRGDIRQIHIDQTADRATAAEAVRLAREAFQQSQTTQEKEAPNV
jgi:hypothetical protein